MTTNSNPAYHCIDAFVLELVEAGLRHVCICPGSRSTPLALAAAERPELRVWTHIDERSAAFFALGLARATENPVALIATSGTAIVNFMPAVTEAFHGRVPLLILSADRPAELRDIGSNQTIDQAHLFGSHVRWSLELPLPDHHPQTLRYFRMAASRAFATASADPAGPVQLNFPLREPLVPSGRRVAREMGSAPLTTYRPARAPDADTVSALAEELSAYPRGLIVSGPDTPRDALEPILELAHLLGYPILADPLSGLRTSGVAPGRAGVDNLIDTYDILLQEDHLAESLAPDLIIRFGAAPTSKPLNLFMQRHEDRLQIVVDPGDEWRDPILSATRFLYVDPASLATSLNERLGDVSGEAAKKGAVGKLTANSSTEAPNPNCTPSEWLQRWRDLNSLLRAQIFAEVDDLDEPFEGRVLHELARMIPAGSSLYVGNSMPIREMDTFFPVIDRSVSVYGNRGVSGIDGVVSSALGVSAAGEGPLLLVIGDLSFYHDLNGLLAAKLHDLDATIIVINNDGGGIFSYLPQAELPDHFELLFGTPIGLDFRPVVEMYGGHFSRTSNWTDFIAEVQRGIGEPGLHVVEFNTDRVQNSALRRELIARVRAEIRELGARAFSGPVERYEFHELNGARYRVRIAGEGEPLLLLHGFTGSLETWDPFIPDLAARFRTLSIDLLGHGQTDAPAEPERYQMDRMADDLVALLDRLGIERTNLLGYSMGGRLALHLASAAPARVESLILESTGLGIEDRVEREERCARDHELARSIEDDGVPAFVDYWEQVPLFSSQNDLPSEVRAALREQRMRSSAVGLANSLRGAGAGEHELLTPRLSRIEAPTLMIAGELDHKYVEIAAELERLIPGSTATIIPGAGHAVHLEKPGAFVQEVLTFLAQ